MRFRVCCRVEILWGLAVWRITLVRVDFPDLGFVVCFYFCLIIVCI